MNRSYQKRIAQEAIDFLKQNDLCLTTAESCTAGMIVALLSDIEGSGAVIESGYVVYSVPAKQRLLGVKETTIKKYTLCSEEVAREMVSGALHDSTANLSVATTGIAGSEPMNGIAPGTICFAWGLLRANRMELISETKHFTGEREIIREAAAIYAIERLAITYQQLLDRHK